MRLPLSASALVLSTVLSAAALGAQTSTITFDGVPTPSSVDKVGDGHSYWEAGYRLTCSTTGTTPDACSTLDTYGPTNAHWVGSPALFANDIHGTVTLVRQDGLPFDLFSVDIANMLGQSGSVNAVFVGALAAGGTVSQTFVVPGGAPALSTYTLTAGFDDLSSVSWTQQSPYFQVDNLVVTTATPEPASLALLGMGLVGVVGFRRRRARAGAA